MIAALMVDVLDDVLSYVMVAVMGDVKADLVVDVLVDVLVIVLLDVLGPARCSDTDPTQPITCGVCFICACPTTLKAQR